MPAAAVSNFSASGIARCLKFRVFRFLLFKQSLYNIAVKYCVKAIIIYYMASNLLRYKSIVTLFFRRLSRPRRLTIADEDAVLKILFLKKK